MKRSFAALLAAGLLALAGCGGDDGGGGGEGGGGGGDSGYPAEAEENFIRACTSQPQATQEYCQCTFDEITANVTYDEFKEAEEQIGSGGDINQAPPETRDAFNEAIAKCQSEAGAG